MSNEVIELMVEEIMRTYHMKSFEEYNSEELREKYRKKLREEDENNERVK